MRRWNVDALLPAPLEAIGDHLVAPDVLPAQTLNLFPRIHATPFDRFGPRLQAHHVGRGKARGQFVAASLRRRHDGLALLMIAGGKKQKGRVLGFETTAALADPALADNEDLVAGAEGIDHHRPFFERVFHAPTLAIRDRCVEVRCVAVHGDASLWEGTQGENRAAKGGGMRPANHNDLGSQSTASPIGNRRNRRQGRLRHRSSAGRPFAVPLPGPACPPAPPDRPRVFLAFLSARSRDTPANQPTTIQERRVFNRRRCIDPSRK